MEKMLTNLFNGQSYDEKNFFLIAGPCVVESEEMIMEIAEKVYGICKNLGIPYIFKASYRKANRTSASSFTGLGDDAALMMIGKVRQQYSLPATTDIHTAQEAATAAKYVGCITNSCFSLPPN
jgi:2-dehydro-3-deoxyphosphooctonate aldolase (KDO 8-P synthase)